MQNPKLERLQTDYERIKKLESESGGLVRIIQTINNPPREYTIELICPSLTKKPQSLASLNNSIGNRHRIKIILGTNYPTESPIAMIETPIYNPHVKSNNGAICLGRWNVGESLDMLTIRIGALLQLDPRVLDDKSPYNSDAMEWIKKSGIKLPLGKVVFQQPEQNKRIEWKA